MTTEHGAILTINNKGKKYGLYNVYVYCNILVLLEIKDYLYLLNVIPISITESALGKYN